MEFEFIDYILGFRDLTKDSNLESLCNAFIWLELRAYNFYSYDHKIFILWFFFLVRFNVRPFDR